MGDRKLPTAQRAAFQQPWGTDLTETALSALNAQHKLIITVGDVVSLTARNCGIVPLLAVYDGFTERRETTGFAALVQREGLAETVVVNPAGMVTSALEEAVKTALAGRSAGIIRVEGEEDLALLPCVLCAPDGAVVVYGWPGRGMKAVVTDGASRIKAGQMLGLMEELK